MPASGRIVEMERPSLDRSRVGNHSPVERPEHGYSGIGRILDDRLNGRPFYPEPPRPGRSISRSRRLLNRTSAPFWFFVALAGVRVVAALIASLRVGLWSGHSSTWAFLAIAYAGALTLLPAAVLIWHPDAWRSARLVLVGAIVWTTPPALAGIGRLVVGLLGGLGDQPGFELTLIVTVLAVAGYVGPAIVAAGLELARRRRTVWLAPMAWRAFLILTLVAFMAGSRLTLGSTWWRALQKGGLDATQGALAVREVILPLEWLCLMVLAWSCLLAVMLVEPQRRLWQCALVGAVIMAWIGLDGVRSGYHLAYVPGMDGLLASGLESSFGTAIQLGGLGIVLLAFTSPAWSMALDATGPAYRAPEEIFAWGTGAGADGTEPIDMRAVAAVAAGTRHALALDEKGEVDAWGDDTWGQTDVPQGLVDVRSIAAGDDFSLALRADGTVAAWGANDCGQTDVPADLADVAAIAAGGTFALALRTDGTVVSWGDASRGATSLPARLSDVIAITAGDLHALALRRDGTVLAWGANDFGQCQVPAELAGVTAISAGGSFSLALCADGTVAAWGDSGYGQLDVPPGLQNVTAIAAGSFHALVLLTDGDIVGWGGGDQSHGEACHPWHLVDFKAVAAGDGFSLAIRAA